MSAVEQLVALGVPEAKAKQASSKTVGASVAFFLAEVSDGSHKATALATDAAVLREKAAAILELATRVKVTDGSESARKLLIRTLLAPAGKNIETPEQIAAAVKFVQAQDKDAPVNEEAFAKAAGVGVVVNEAAVHESAKKIVTEMETRLRDAGWGLQGEVTGKLSQAQPFASGKLKREAVVKALTDLIGPDKGDAKELHKQKLKEERKAKKKDETAETKPAETSSSASAADGTTAPPAAASGQVITPWDVQAEGGVNYDLLLQEFGTQLITCDLLDRMKSLSLPVHHFLRRKIFFSHRDFDAILGHLERKEPVYLYTGRGPSSQAMHLGHLIPFMFTKYLQDALNVPLVIQMTDDEKYLFKHNLTLDYDPETGVQHMMRENAKDIIALGFNRETTLIFSDLDFMGGEFYKNVVRVQRHININQANKTFGFDLNSSIGQVAFPAIQASPSFPTSFPDILDPNAACLIPCAIDQDPYFRLTRDVAPKLRYKKPSLIHSKFFPAMEGISTKMSASAKANTVFLTDNPEEIREKIHKYAFSGAPALKKDLEEKGVNLEVDVAYQYLTFFLDDDEELERIHREYGAGRMLTRDVKERLVQILQKIVKDHQEARARVTEEEVDYFMNVNKFKKHHPQVTSAV